MDIFIHYVNPGGSGVRWPDKNVVVPRERSDSRDLRIFLSASLAWTAKVLRLAMLAQDDNSS